MLRQVRSVESRAAGGGVLVTLDDGFELAADVAVLAPGPGAARLLEGLGVSLALRPRPEQVVHFGDAAFPGATDGLPSFVDRRRRRPHAPRAHDTGDNRADAPPHHGVRPAPLDAQVCSWTESPARRFVLDTLPGGIVVACGDSGEGFKFSALMGLASPTSPKAGRPTRTLPRSGSHASRPCSGHAPVPELSRESQKGGSWGSGGSFGSSAGVSVAALGATCLARRRESSQARVAQASVSGVSRMSSGSARMPASAW